MRITPEMLRRIIKEEMSKANKSERLQEGTSNRPIQITSKYLNRIIREEYTAFKNLQKLSEAKKNKENVYYY